MAGWRYAEARAESEVIGNHAAILSPIAVGVFVEPGQHGQRAIQGWGPFLAKQVVFHIAKSATHSRKSALRKIIGGSGTGRLFF